MQALSGAGYPGVPSLDATDNVIPFIGGEDEKVESETRKLLGVVSQGTVIDAEMTVSAQCNRVNVTDGHMASIRVKLARSGFAGGDSRRSRLVHGRAATVAASHCAGESQSSSEMRLIVPQPRLDRDAGNGMSRYSRTDHAGHRF